MLPSSMRRPPESSATSDLRRGDTSFQAQVNRTLSRLYRSGLVQIYERWFGPFAAASPLTKALYLLHSWPD
jgi:ABC-type amino acid transport substrate-binding protein